MLAGHRAANGHPRRADLNENLQLVMATARHALRLRGDDDRQEARAPGFVQRTWHSLMQPRKQLSFT